MGRKNNELWLSSPECGDGWKPLIQELHASIMAIYPDYEIQQIKEKFGSLRYYIGGVPEEHFDAVHNLINEAVRKADTLCEVCGSLGRLASRGSWVKTVCEDHLDGRVFVEYEEGDDTDD